MTGLSNNVARPSSEIGGYFGLDLPDYGEAFPNALKYQSGRAALRAVLESAEVDKVLLPSYICGSVIQAVIDAGAVVETYWLENSLYPMGLPDALPERSALLYVNYFGLCETNVSRLLQAFPSQQLIIDNSQALLAKPTKALATIYSPRKFIGVPDGGLLVTSELNMEDPEQEDTGSLGRMRHLLLRMAYTAQDGYPNYLEAESTLSNTKPLRMSRLTKRILAGIDMTMVAHQRRENFVALATRLEKYNFHEWKLDSEAVPLCYPLVVAGDVRRFKKNLTEKGVYIPTYWPAVKPRVADGIEYRLTNCCLAVPCDQRYSLDQMSYLADEIISGLESMTSE